MRNDSAHIEKPIQRDIETSLLCYFYDLYFTVAIIGEMMSFRTLPNLKILKVKPSANDNSFGLNQLTIRVLCEAFIASPPRPNTILPNIIKEIDLKEHPREKNSCPKRMNTPNRINIERYPYFTVRIPPIKGIAIFGKE
jgi:hypothetical protein